MAELSYEHVRQATREAVNAFESALRDLTMTVRNIQNELTRVNSTQGRVMGMEQSLNNVMTVVQKLETIVRNLQDTTLDRSRSDTEMLKNRIDNIEQVLGDMSNYLRSLHDYAARLVNMYPGKEETR